jgi:hypothetical protein
MIERFFLDRVDTQGDGVGVSGSVKDPVFIGSDSAYAVFGRSNHAFHGA